MGIATSIFNICYLRQLLFSINAIAFINYQVPGPGRKKFKNASFW